MQLVSQNQPSKFTIYQLGGYSALLSSLFFVVVTAYLFGYLANLGFTTEMLDDHIQLYTWMAQHNQAYQITWLFYFLSQLFLLPLPITLHHYLRKQTSNPNPILLVGTVFGIVAITLAMIGPVIFFSSNTILAKTFTTIMQEPGSQTMFLLISTLFADVGKYLRLFSEIVLSIWLTVIGLMLIRSAQPSKIGWFSLLVAGWMFIIVSIKLFNPASPFEDFLGLLLAIIFGTFGIWLLQK